ncbi:MAG: TPM domain-containing protein [Desulfobulbaceae bacterium]
MKAENFFSPSDKAAITAAIEQVEKTTSGEIAVMVVDRSDSYPEGSLRAGLVLGGLFSFIITDLYLDGSLTWFLPLFAAALLFITWITRYVPGLRRLFVTDARMTEMVREQAVQEFYGKGLYQTRDATAVFFFLSLFERKLWILADKGINSKLSPDELQEYAADIAAAVRTGRAAEVLCSKIARLGQVLAEHFPPRPDDENELSDQVMTR